MMYSQTPVCFVVGWSINNSKLSKLEVSTTHWHNYAPVQVYKERVLTVAENCAKEAAKTGAKRFIHISTAQVYDCDKVSPSLQLPLPEL